MEGDSPSFIYLIPTGLGAPEHPDWGSWGVRYGTVSIDFGLWSSSADAVPGTTPDALPGSASATVSRWHGAYRRLRRAHGLVEPMKTARILSVGVALGLTVAALSASAQRATQGDVQ
jgi:hypothetical protein